MRINKWYIIIVYLIAVILFVLHFIGICFVPDRCGFYSNTIGNIIRLVILFCTPLFGYILCIAIKISKGKRYILTALLPLTCILLGLVLESNYKESKLYNFDLVVRKAKVSNIYSGNSSQFLTVNFTDGNYNYLRKINVRKYGAKNFNIGDSILVIYAIDCDVLCEMFIPFPTKAQFEQFEKNPNYDKHLDK